MESYEKALYLEEAALNSAGYATQKLDIYLTGIDARMQDLTNTWKEFGKELVSSDLVKTFISLGKTILNVIKVVVRLFDSWGGKAILSVLAAILVFKTLNSTLTMLWSKVILKAIQGIQTFIIQMHLAGMEGMTFSAKMQMVGASINAALGPIGWIALALTALIAIFTAVSGAQEKAKQKQEEYIESLKTKYNETLEFLEQTQNQIASLESLGKQLQQTGGDVVKMTDLQEDLSKALGRSVNFIDQQKNSYEALVEEINLALSVSRELEKTLLQQRKKQAFEIYEAEPDPLLFTFSGMSEYFEADVAKLTKEEYNKLLDELDKGLKGGAYQKARSRLKEMYESIADENSELFKKNLKNSATLAGIYAEELQDQFGDTGLQKTLGDNLANIINRAIMYAKPEEVPKIIEALTPELVEVNELFSNLAKTRSPEVLAELESKLRTLTITAPQLNFYIEDMIKGSYNWLKATKDNQHGIIELRAAINNEIDGLKKLESQYKSLAEAEKGYLDIKKNILKQLEDLTLEEQRAVLGYTVDVATGEIAKTAPDYSAIEDNETIKILREIDELYNQYQADITGLTDEQLLQNTELTNEYNRQLKMLEKQFAINQKNLEIQKAQIKLANAEAERNVRMFVGGQWIWTANPEAVATAQADVTKLEQDKNQAILDAETQEQADNAIRLTEQMSSTISLWERMNQQMNDNLLRGDEAFGALIEQSYGLAGAFNAILNKVLSKEEFSTLKGELEGLIGKPLSFDTGGSLGSQKGYFLKDTSQEELILNPRNTTATKSLLNKLPELESIINKLVSGFLIPSPQMASNLQGQGELGEVFNINNLNVTYSGKDILELLRQIKTKVPSGA